MASQKFAGKFKSLDIVTAEAAFEAYGKNLDEVFANSALAIAETMTNSAKIKPKIKKSIKLVNSDLNTLLVDFLNEIVRLTDTDKLFFSKFKIKITDAGGTWILQAELAGEKINPKKHELRADIKAVTWHMFELKKGRTGWTARVVLDV